MPPGINILQKNSPAKNVKDKGFRNGPCEPTPGWLLIAY